MSLFLALSPFWATAQQESMYTQYMFNTLSVNPAYAGTRDVLSLAFLTRHQWVGIDGAPDTQTLNLHGPLKKESVGLGLSLNYDRIGPIKETGIFGDFSFRLKLSEGSFLSLGAKGGFSRYEANLTSLNVLNPDPSFSQDVDGRLLPNFGAGAYFFTRKFYLGLSVPRLVKNVVTQSGVNTGSVGRQERHFFFIGGYAHEINRDWVFKPSFLVKYTAASPVSVDLSASMLFKQRLWLGVNLRVGDSFSGIVQYRILENFWAGYSYDFSTNDLSQFNNGTHEISLIYDFYLKNQSRVRSPRYF